MCETEVKAKIGHTLQGNDGKSYSIDAISENYITVTDENGKTIRHPKTAPLFNFDLTDPNVIAKYDKNIEEYKEQKLFFTDLAQYYRKKKNSLLSDFGVRLKCQMNQDQLAQFKVVENDLYATNSSRIFFSNKLGSELLHKFLYIT